MRTKKKAIRRVTSVPTLESIEVSTFGEGVECHREELMRESDVGYGTFDVSSDCGCATPMFADRPSESGSHAAHVWNGSVQEITGRFPVTYVAMPTFGCLPFKSCAFFKKTCLHFLLGECNVQGSQPSELANLSSSASYVNKGKEKVTGLCSEDAFGSGGASSTALSPIDDTEFHCNFPFFGCFLGSYKCWYL